MNYKELAESILKDVGGKDNINHLEHCSTRLRFTLKDDSKVDVGALESTKGVLGLRMNAQCQVIIGNDVVEVYDELTKITGNIIGTSGGQKRKFSAIFLDFLVGVFQPLVPAIAGGGVLKSLLLLVVMFGWMSAENPTYQVLNLIGTAPIYFLPILVAFTTAQKLRVNPIVAVSAVGVMLLPEFTTMVAGGTTLFSFPIENITYSSQVFPAILTVLFYAQIEKFFTKHTMKAIRIFFVPMMSLLITVPVALLILGPLGYNIGALFTSVILFIAAKIGWLALGILGGVLPLMVAAGMHKALTPYGIDSIAKTGFDALYLPASLAHNISESGACFAVALKSKDEDKKSIAMSAAISALFGITEPALYGVTLVNKKVLYSVMASGFISGCLVGLVSLKAFVMVGPGLASMSMFVDLDNPMNIMWGFIVFVLAFFLSFVLSFIFYKEEVFDKEIEEAENDNPIMALNAPIKGKVIPLEEINDDVFASGIVGDGIGIIPQDGLLAAPFEGEVTMVFNTKHALGLKLPNGAEVLFHIGIDTVQLNGQGFESLVKVGDNIVAGQGLIKFDLELIEKNKIDPVVIVLVTNKNEFIITKEKLNEEVDVNNIILEIQEKERGKDYE